MSRTRIEALLSSFPKLVSDSEGHDANSQHTFIETESIRYVYQPIEHLYLVLVTTKSSNIVQDLETLRLLSKLVAEHCSPIVTEETVLESSFELVFAFDEVISLGHKENITLSQIRINLEMDSHEEKLHDMIRKSKEQEAKDEMRRKATQIKATQRSSGGQDPRRSSFGNNAYAGQAVSPMAAASSDATTGFSSSSRASTSEVDAKARAPQKGMKLGSKRKDNDFFKAMAKEDGISVSAKPAMSLKNKKSSAAAAPGAVSGPSADVEVVVCENVSVEYTSDGSLKSASINGQLQLTCFAKDVKAKIQCQVPSVDDAFFQFNTHPHVDKSAWGSDNTLQLKSASKSYPVDKTLSVLKWRVKPSVGEGISEKIPLTINSWPERSSDDGFSVNIEYELTSPNVELTNVRIVVPLPGNEAPEILGCEVGTAKYNSRKGRVEWEIDLVNSDSASGSLEFEVQEKSRSADESLFFPTVVDFECDDTLCGITVLAVEDNGGKDLKVEASERRLTLDKYEISYD